VVPLSTAYALAEAVGVERSVSRSFREAPLFLGLFTGLVGVGAGIALAPGNLIALLINTQVINGLITPIILTFILILANRRSVLGTYSIGPSGDTSLRSYGVYGISAGRLEFLEAITA